MSTIPIPDPPVEYNYTSDNNEITFTLYNVSPTDGDKVSFTTYPADPLQSTDVASIDDDGSLTVDVDTSAFINGDEDSWILWDRV